MEINRLLMAIAENGFDISKASALELFGYDGSMHTMAYADKVKSLDIWEYDAKLEDRLRKNLPHANIKICDSYEQIKGHSMCYDLIVADTPIQTQYGHCEHFDLFPDIFKIMNDDCLLILNVIPVTNKSYPELESEYHLNKRKSFYNAVDPKQLSDIELYLTYRSICTNSNFYLEWNLMKSRGFVYYLAIKLKKMR